MKNKKSIYRSAETVEVHDTLRQAAAKMKHLNIRTIPVMEDDRLAGVITDRDIAVRAVSEGLNPDTTTVGEIMTREAFYCYDDHDLREVARLMKDGKVSRIVVADQARKPVE